MNESTRRFLSEVTARIGEDRIVEMRLFPAIRQGGIESAIAVLAVEPRPVEHADATAVAFGNGEGEAKGVLALQLPAPAAPDAHRVGDEETTDRLTERVADLRVVFETENEIEGADLGRASASPDSRRSVAEREVPLASVADFAPPGAGEPEAIALGDILALPSPSGAQPADIASQGRGTRERLEIHTARYLLVFKGPERGKWALDIVHEADAPLETLERVVQGVSRRAGDTAETEVFSGHALRQALDQPAWA
jgi:hypothetical protein